MPSEHDERVQKHHDGDCLGPPMCGLCRNERRVEREHEDRLRAAGVPIRKAEERVRELEADVADEDDAESPGSAGWLLGEVERYKQRVAELENPCGCAAFCGDDGDIDGPGICKGLPRHADEPLALERARVEKAEQRIAEMERERDNYRAMYQSAEGEFKEAIARFESAEALLAKARTALQKIIDAYDEWNVNNYPADGGSRNAARAWFAEAQAVENAMAHVEAVLAEITTASKEGA